MSAGEGMHRGVLWDDEHQVILAATNNTGFITKIGINLRPIDPEPRVFTVKDRDGKEIPIRVGLTNTTTTMVGPPTDERVAEWTRKRIYRDEVTRLAEQRRFVQYKPEPGTLDQHEKALGDLRLLINQYGEKGAWLWDPYLTADDVLRTLFYCSHTHAELRALSAGRAIPELKTAKATPHSRLGKLLQCFSECFSKRAAPPKVSFADQQRAVFDGANSNFRGLRLEFRVRTGQAGWAFHDRFLIFPDTGEGPLAWSLGASVNSMGRQHHILQRVDNGQLMADAFDDLWKALRGPEHLVWKKP
jgi:hypothetical protein